MRHTSRALRHGERRPSGLASGRVPVAEARERCGVSRSEAKADRLDADAVVDQIRPRHTARLLTHLRAPALLVTNSKEHRGDACGV